MAVMIAGLVLFIGIHFLPLAPSFRDRLVARFGDRPYRGLFSAVAGLGLVLIIVGWHMRPERAQFFAPLAAARAAAPALVTIAFALFAAANMRTHIRRMMRHPMLIGLMLWSGVHLIANGDFAGTILFGSFFAYSGVALIAAIQRGTVKMFVPDWKHDLMAVTGGIVLSYLTIRLHPVIFGTGPVA